MPSLALTITGTLLVTAFVAACLCVWARRHWPFPLLILPGVALGNWQVWHLLAAGEMTDGLTRAFAWNVPLLIMLLYVTTLRRASIQSRREKEGRCPTCGYDVRGVICACPECGAPVGGVLAD